MFFTNTVTWSGAGGPKQWRPGLQSWTDLILTKGKLHTETQEGMQGYDRLAEDNRPTSQQDLNTD